MSELRKLRKMTDDQLVEYVGGWKQESPNYIAGMIELRRRQERPNEIRGWIALGIAGLSFVISITALLGTAAPN